MARSVEKNRPRKVRRYKNCRCRKGRSPLLDTAHTPLARWGFTVLALISFTTQLAGPALFTTLLAWWAWRHR